MKKLEFASVLLSMAVFSACSTQASRDYTCQEALDRLNACFSSHCKGNVSDVCDMFEDSKPTSLLGEPTNPCSQMGEVAINHIMQSDCDALIAEGNLVLTGKADSGCPPYFPWCSQISEESSAYAVTVTSFEEGSISLDFVLKDMDYSSTVHDQVIYHTLHIGGAAGSTELGYPDLPSIGLTIGVPGTTDSAWIDSHEITEAIQIPDINVIPFQGHTLEGETQGAFQIQEDIYRNDSICPGHGQHLFMEDEISTWRNYRVVRLQVWPVLFNPVKQELVVAKKISVKLGFGDFDGAPPDTIDVGEDDFSGSYENTMVNYKELTDSNPKTDSGDRVRYLIVVHDPLKEAIEPLVRLKEEQGYVPEVVSLSYIVANEEGLLTERIKKGIERYYQEYGIEYALLVGDVDDLPLYNWDGKNPSDIWYGCLTGDDLLAEVAIGRISGKTPEEIGLHVQKIIDYEESYDIEQAWRRKVLLIAHGQGFPEKYTGCVESIRNQEYESELADFRWLYGAQLVSNDDIISAVNEGAGIINYRGHGKPSTWFEWNGTDFDLHDALLTNTGRLPVVFSVACNNLALQAKEQSLAEQWVQYEGGGAVAFLGATLPSYTKINHDFNRFLFDGLLNKKVFKIGPLLNHANAKLLEKYGDERETRRNIQIYSWLGDPSLSLGDAFFNPDVPIAVAGNDQEVREGEVVTLQGGFNGDQEIQGLAYTWTQTAGPEVQLNDPNVEQTYFVAPEVGHSTRLVFDLVIGRNQLESNPDSVEIMVRPNWDIDMISEDTPLKLPKKSTGSVSSKIPVQASDTIASVEVDITLSRDYGGELQFELQHPDGDSVVLPGFHPSVDASGNLREVYPINDFYGLSTSGTWSLIVSNLTYYTSGGTMDRWVLRIVKLEEEEPQVLAGDLKITEIMVDPATGSRDPKNEWFEIHNTTSHPINLTGMQITDEDGSPMRLHTIDEDVIVPPDAYVVLAHSAYSDLGFTPIYQYGSTRILMANTGDQIVILNCYGLEIDRVDFAAEGMPRIESGVSIQLDESKSTWCQSSASTFNSAGELGNPSEAGICPP